MAFEAADYRGDRSDLPTGNLRRASSGRLARIRQPVECLPYALPVMMKQRLDTAQRGVQHSIDGTLFRARLGRQTKPALLVRCAGPAQVASAYVRRMSTSSCLGGS